MKGAPVAAVILILVGGLSLLARQSTSGSIEGVVVHANTAEPLGHVYVTLERGGGGPRTALTGTDGRFSFRDLPPSDYSIEHWQDGYTGDDVAVTLHAGEHLRDLIVHMAAAAAINGRVLDSDGEPVVGTEVTALRPGYNF